MGALRNEQTTLEAKGEMATTADPFPIDGSRDALWMATAVDAPETTKLQESRRCDVAVIGAGFTGLNAALRLAEKGVSVAVLEARTLGFGSSGRSGGQVNLGLNTGPKALIERFGSEKGERLVHKLASVPDDVFALIRRHQLNCDPVQNGWVQGAVTPSQLKAQQELAAEYAPYGAGFDVLDRNEVAKRSGAQGFAGGLFCPSAGSLQPLSYTRELARVAIAQGARIFTETAITALHRDGGRWRLETAQGEVDCETALVCSNAYTDGLIDGLAETLVPVRSILAATEPLPERLRAKILPDQVTFVDKRRLILYCRYDRNGRLCIGDHGPMRDAFRPADFDALKARARRLFPDLAHVRWDYHWGGRVAMTRGGLPFLQLIDRGLVAGMGYNGRGVGMGSVMGQVLADYALGTPEDDLAFPVTTPKRYPFHRFHRLGVTAAVKWYGLLDRLEMLRSYS